MKSVIITLGIFLCNYSTFAQNPQFAVVRPNGTTYICPTIDSAYNKAIAGDNIYLPGGTFTLSNRINKRLFIYGAGHHPDSTNVTGRTILNELLVDTGAVGGSVEGIIALGNIMFPYSGKHFIGYTIKRCRATFLFFDNNNNVPPDSLPSNVLVTESIINIVYGNNAKGNLFSKNMFIGNAGGGNPISMRNSSYLNNIFISSYSIYPDNCIFDNNIFLNLNAIVTPCNSTFHNNLVLGGGTIGSNAGCQPNTITEINTINGGATASDIFVSYAAGNAGFPYLDNYHLKPTCPGVNAGTDGFDVGIYGTAAPTSVGWVPSNPHIYFKQVALQTNSSGQLQIQFKVRTNN